ncbi:MraZ N-terminal domain-containing protein [Luteolibacter marinus]|uniref:MraZ N-terminal domain-containing protein n=1 Tax=Luteolibacter marinus TaxID=2776705 RepID=UPI0018667E94|nr:MraZ N-terminal domain-containing protein [Luteolibacter marinus]
MSSLAKVYESHFDYKMDPKYRVSIPVDWRPETEETPVRLQLSKEHDLPVIKVFTEEEFEKKFVQVAESSLTPAKKQQIVGHLRMMSKKATISSQGKLTVPKDWSEKVGLKAEGQVILGGRDNHYLICPQDTFDKITELEFGMDDGDLGVV